MTYCHLYYEPQMPRVNESWHIWMSGWVTSRMNESCHVWIRGAYRYGVCCIAGATAHGGQCSWDSCVGTTADAITAPHIMNYTCHAWMSHVTYWHGLQMSRMKESCHVWMRHVTYAWVISRMDMGCLCRYHCWCHYYRLCYESPTSRVDKSCHTWIWITNVTCVQVMSHMDLDYECHVWISHVTYGFGLRMSRVNESCHG